MHVVLCVCYCLHKLDQSTHRIQTSCQTNSLRRTSHLGLRKPQKAQEDPGIGCSCRTGHVKATAEPRKMPCCACHWGVVTGTNFWFRVSKIFFLFITSSKEPLTLNTQERKEFPNWRRVSRVWRRYQNPQLKTGFTVMETLSEFLTEDRFHGSSNYLPSL